MRELMLWREVFSAEYYELHPDKKPQTEEENIERVKTMLAKKSAASKSNKGR